jgi:glycosyltransferase involved in cell wall biosynthesis
METVSVIIPTYNRAELISQAIDSVLAQTVPAHEIIVADDGSTDDTAAVVAAYGDRVRYLALPHRGQPAATRNAGIRAATGVLLAFLDSDDLFLPDKLARQIAALAQTPAAGVVYSNGLYFRTTPDAPVGACSMAAGALRLGVWRAARRQLPGAAGGAGAAHRAGRSRTLR